MDRKPPISVALTCTDCDKSTVVEVPAVYVDPRPADVDPNWNGIFLVRLIKCDACGAVDRYRISPEDIDALRLRARRDSGSVLVRRVNVLDGKPARRPSEVLDRIRAALDERPKDGGLWRRLGNAWNLLGDLDAAAEAWSRGVDVDKGEFGAALSLAVLALHRDDPERATAMLVETLSRIGGLPSVDNPPDRLRRRSSPTFCSISSKRTSTTGRGHLDGCVGSTGRPPKGIEESSRDDERDPFGPA